MLGISKKLCKGCGRPGHSAFTCPNKPRATLTAKKPMRKYGKPMKKLGKIGKALARQSHEYREENPPNHEGYYVCYLCGKWVPANEMNPEHTKSKARHPEFRFDKGKLKPACGDCNEKKRSMDVEEVREMQRRGVW